MHGSLRLQAAVKKEAMESSIEEQLRDKEAVQAENAAQQALILQHEAEVRTQDALGYALMEFSSLLQPRVVACLLCFGAWASDPST